jgi:hypothetical protein
MKRLNLERRETSDSDVVYSVQPNWPGFTAKCGEDAHCVAFA